MSYGGLYRDRQSIFYQKDDLNSDMPKPDRLSALIGRFEITVRPTPPNAANLVLFQNKTDGTLTRVCFTPHDTGPVKPETAETIAFAAHADWGGASNPLLSALPAQITLPAHADLLPLLQVMQTEIEAQRCGAGAVLDRMGEVLFIHLLRAAIESGTTGVGLLAGLADPRLSRAIVAMHEDPSRKWQGSDLAQVAGLSQSRFSELFHARVGETPAAYLRQWRMVLARQDAERGDRIQTIARRYGYGSPEALSRAFKRAHSVSAIQTRNRG